MSSFNYFVDTEIFKIAVKVMSSILDINIDVVEFAVNDPPKVKSLYVSTADKYHNYTMRTLIDITTRD